MRGPFHNPIRPFNAPLRASAAPGRGFSLSDLSKIAWACAELSLEVSPAGARSLPTKALGTDGPLNPTSPLFIPFFRTAA